MPYFYRNNIKYSGGSDSVDLTMAEYKELEANGKVVQDTTYYIIDADENIPSRPNLLINSNFANPVNQRGFTTATLEGVGKQYLIDRWCLVNDQDIDKSSATLGDGYLQINVVDTRETASIYQILEQLPHGTYSLSAKIDNKIYRGTLTYNGEYAHVSFDGNVYLGITHVNSNPAFFIGINPNAFTSAKIEWAKLELGEYATPYVPRLYDEEFIICQRYYQVLRSRLSRVYYITTNNVKFILNFNIPMRVPPTCTGGGSLAVNIADTTGWSSDLSDTEVYVVYILYTKNSHGLKFEDNLSLNGWIYADAEL